MADDSLVREVAQLRTDLQADIAQLRADFAGAVNREVHAAELGRLSDRVDVVERDVQRLENGFETYKTTERERRQRIEDKRRGDRRLLWGAILGAAASIAVGLLRTVGLLI